VLRLHFERRRMNRSIHSIGSAVAVSAALTLAACGDETEPDATSVEYLNAATAVWVAALPEGDSADADIRLALEAAEFHEASKSRADAIIQILSDRDAYMTSDNACFDQAAAIRFDYPNANSLFAVVGLVCWNVDFEPASPGDPVPSGGYLLPAELVDLGNLLHDVDPSIDISELGE